MIIEARPIWDGLLFCWGLVASYDVSALNYDVRAGSCDKRGLSYDKASANYDRIATSYDKRASNYDLRNLSYDKRLTSYDKLSRRPKFKIQNPYGTARSRGQLKRRLAPIAQNLIADANYDLLDLNCDKRGVNYDVLDLSYDKRALSYDLRSTNYDKPPCPFAFRVSEMHPSFFSYEKAKSTFFTPHPNQNPYGTVRLRGQLKEGWRRFHWKLDRYRRITTYLR
ncbi:hypothetical protein [Planococcus sp. YIM B11945]|uniref:hypothetical protein n=1 Tax=Planococcus sp. YIM B11945 TaxID=3435410 RepID=UPI003D7E9E8B